MTSMSEYSNKRSAEHTFPKAEGYMLMAVNIAKYSADCDSMPAEPDHLDFIGHFEEPLPARVKI